MDVKAILFDLDGTLWQASTALDLQLVQRIQHRRLAARLEAWSLQGGNIEPRMRRFWEELDAAEKQPNPSHRERDYGFLLGKVLQKQGIGLNSEQAQVLWEDLYVPHPSFPKELFEDTLETLSLLRHRGFKLGLVSNRPWASILFRPELDALGLGAYLEVVVSSTDVGFRKPHPLIFETALRALQVEASEALMVGESLANDVAGAEACGMRAVWKTSAVDQAQASGRLVIRSLSGVLEANVL